MFSETAIGYAAGPAAAMLLLRLGGGNHAAEKIVHAGFAHAPGVGQLSRTCGVENLIARRQDDGCRDTGLDRIPILRGDAEVAIEVADVDFDHDKLLGDELRVSRILQRGVERATIS